MSAVFGILNRDGAPVDAATFDIMMGPPELVARADDGRGTWVDGPRGLACRAFHVTPESLHERQPLHDAETGVTLVADVRLDNREELISALAPVAPARGGVVTDPELLLAAYRRWGTECPPRLTGDFVFALWDARTHTLFVACDALGARTVYTLDDPRRFVLASEIAGMLDLPDVEARINELLVLERLAGVFVPRGEAVFEGIRILEPGHALTLRDGRLHRWRYWSPEPQAPIRYARDDEYTEHFLELLDRAVRCRMRSIGPVGVMMSGGCDSTLVAALAAGALGDMDLPQQALRSYSYVFKELRACDESEYIEAVVDHLGLDAAYVDGDRLWAFCDLDQPSVPRQSLWINPVIQLARASYSRATADGCRVLLDGHFGDMIFAGSLFRVQELVRQRNWRALCKLESRVESRWVMDVLRVLLRPVVPSSIRDALRMRRRLADANPAVEPRLTAKLLGRIEAEASPLPGRLTHLAHSIRMTSEARLAGNEVHSQDYPLARCSPYFDRALAEFILSIPMTQLYRQGHNRWLQRNAMRRRLPDCVCSRVDKTSLSSVLRLGLKREHKQILEIANHASVVRRGWILASWIEEALTRREGEIRDVQAWPLTVTLRVELWLRGVAEAERSGTSWRLLYKPQCRSVTS